MWPNARTTRACRPPQHVHAAASQIQDSIGAGIGSDADTHAAVAVAVDQGPQSLQGTSTKHTSTTLLHLYNVVVLIYAMIRVPCCKRSASDSAFHCLRSSGGLVAAGTAVVPLRARLRVRRGDDVRNYNPNQLEASDAVNGPRALKRSRNRRGEYYADGNGYCQSGNQGCFCRSGKSVHHPQPRAPPNHNRVKIWSRPLT